MEYIEKRGQHIPRLTLGTVQFGIPYGLRADARAAAQDEVDAALQTAFDAGVTGIDTAAAYGDSEEKIGSWIERTGNAPLVVTKVHGLDTASEAALIASMRTAADRSRARLRLSRIPVLMVHHFDEYQSHKTWFDRAFEALKDEGVIECSGVSAYSADDYFAIADSGLDAVQIPVNILDWKQIDSGGIRALEGMIVFARSIYLQGLLLRTPESLWPRLSFAGETLEKYIALCRRVGMTQRELAMAFALSVPGITSVVMGCRNAAQVRGNIEVFQGAKRLDPERMDEIHALFGHTDARIVNPSLWPREQ